ncbi:hypothetical protein PGT21_036044 [Puccinia graminis f. sp. tritici]|uniref:Uncharacterized protein n=1 Tax=Puccinia graminis f. sp. tritici TaxID=56615 RepID=A0A5B0NED8_PUCGR|nr:hypothetical protein PGT21_036044 [Puccinia graminis f. sp. tritici]
MSPDSKVTSKLTTNSIRFVDRWNKQQLLPARNPLSAIGRLDFVICSSGSSSSRACLNSHWETLSPIAGLGFYCAVWTDRTSISSLDRNENIFEAYN